MVVHDDSGSDKEWTAVSPDPTEKNRDNPYFAWTSFRTPRANSASAVL